MFGHVLVPLDGSTRAECAIPVAARIARASAGEVILLRGVGSPLELSVSPVPFVALGLGADAHRRRAN